MSTVVTFECDADKCDSETFTLVGIVEEGYEEDDPSQYEYRCVKCGHKQDVIHIR